MYLATIQDVLKVIRFSEEITEIQDSIASGLEAGTAALATYLRTDFRRKTITDKFFIEQSINKGGVDIEHFLTSNGFIDNTQPIIIIKADSFANLTASPVDISSNCNINYETGAITYSGDALISAWVSITYTSGFESDSTDDYVYDQEKVPEWLKQAAILKSILHVDAVTPTLRHESADSVDNSAMVEKYNNLVTDKVRYFPAHNKPA